MIEQKNVIGIKEELMPEGTEYTYMAYKFPTREDAEQFFSEFPESEAITYVVVKKDNSLFIIEEVENERVLANFDIDQLYLNESLIFNYQKIACDGCDKESFTFVIIYTLDNKYLLEHQKEIELI
jgi:hypothetical protein